MSTLLVWKEKLQVYYGKYASVIDKVLKFVLGIAVFALINANVGFMKTAASVFVTLGLALICAFLPLTVMTFLAAGLVLLHAYSLSLSVLIVTAIVFVIMYIFYFRFTPGKAWLVLLTPIAFALKIPYVVPIAYGLLGTPVYVVPIACGTMIYYMLHYIKTSSAVLKSGSGESLINGLSSYTKQILQNKEMLVMILAFTICVILVYNIRTRALDHSRKIATAAGVVSNIVVVIVGGMLLGVKTDYVSMFLGSLVAAVVGIVLELLFFSVNYAGAQQVQFEDDEYYYYVKAIPKIAVSAPEKTVKKINERKSEQKSGEKSEPKQHPHAVQKEVWTDDKTEEALLKQSLNKELGIGEEQK